MLHEGRKCIGVFVNRNDNFFIEAICPSIQSEATALGYDVYIFFTASYHESDCEYDRQEISMFSAAPVEKLDGIIVLRDTFQLDILREALLYTLETRAKCPIAYVRSVPEGCDGVYLDETNSMQDLITHLVEQHGLKRIGFVTGWDGHPDCEKRLACCQRVMAEHGLEIPPHMIYKGDMWYGTGDRAFQYFFVENEHPEAIICANDYMALALSEAAVSHGYNIPGDVVITGFDNIADAADAIPSLTTVARDYPQMAVNAVRIVDRRIKEAEQGIVTPEPILSASTTTTLFRESCGCGGNTMANYVRTSQQKSRKIASMGADMQMLIYFNIRCGSCEKIEDLRAACRRHMRDFIGCRDFFLCLYDDNTFPISANVIEDDDSNATLAVGFKDGVDIDEKSIRYNSGKLLPEHILRDEPQAYYILLLHHSTNNLGYLALQLDEGCTLAHLYLQISVVLSGVIQNMHTFNEFRKLSADNYKNSITDPLTGINNRRGFGDQLEEVWGPKCAAHESVAFISIDLDNLKYINDSYGHEQGDFAICTVAATLQELLPPGGFVARIGGDEFLVFLPECDTAGGKAFIKSVRARLAETAIPEGYDFKVEISAGAYSLELNEDSDSRECVRQSDFVMYQNKRKHHRKLIAGDNS